MVRRTKVPETDVGSDDPPSAARRAKTVGLTSARRTKRGGLTSARHGLEAGQLQVVAYRPDKYLTDQHIVGHDFDPNLQIVSGSKTRTCASIALIQDTGMPLESLPDNKMARLVVDLLGASPIYRQAAADVGVLLSLAAGAGATYSDQTVNLTQRARDLMSRVAIEAAVRRSVLDEGTFTAVEVGELLASSGKNSRDKASRLRTKGDLLGLDVDGRVLYPAFQIDPTRAALREGVGEANQVLGAANDPWGVASWWTSPHGRLRHGQSPADLAVEGDTVRLAALVAAAVTQD